MLLLHALAVAAIALATLYLLARAVLAHVGAADYFTAYNYRWIGARSAGAHPFLWVGPLVIARHFNAHCEVLCERFAGENGPARTVGLSFAGVSVSLDMHDRTARALMAAPYALMALYVASQLADPDVTTLAQRLVILGMVAILAHFGSSLVEKDRLRTALHYATRGADDEAHEAYERGRNDGVRYEVERQKFATGQRYESPAYPANPYAA